MTGGKSGHDTGAVTPSDRDPTATQAMFLERESYRRRRLMDVARLLPLFGVFLLMIPLLWSGSDPAGVTEGQTGAMPMSKAITYIFAVWAALIAASLLFGIAARHWSGDEHPQKRGQG